MRINPDGILFFQRGDKVRPRNVVRYDEKTGEHTTQPHPSAWGKVVFDRETEELKRQQGEDVVAFVDEGSQQIQLRSWLQVAAEVPERFASMRSRAESHLWYEAVGREDQAPPTPIKARRGTGTPQAA